MAQQNPATDVRDDFYDLVSVLYHELQAAETASRYAADAEQANDDELSRFFLEAVETHKDLADRAKPLLQARLEKSTRGKLSADKLADEASKLSFPASDAPAY